jgi:hypothetical protein
MPSQATITSKIGPGFTATATVLPNLTQFNMDLNKKVLTTQSDRGTVEYDIAATTTLTCTISAGNATIVVSQ